MSTLTQDFATILEQYGFGIIGTDIFVEDDTPMDVDEIITVTNLGSPRPDPPPPLITLHLSEVQVTVRGRRGGHQECESRVDVIRCFLKTLGNYSVNDSTFVYINHQTGPTSLGIDTKMRPRYTVDFSCLRSDPPLP